MRQACCIASHCSCVELTDDASFDRYTEPCLNEQLCGSENGIAALQWTELITIRTPPAPNSGEREGGACPGLVERAPSVHGSRSPDVVSAAAAAATTARHCFC